MKTNIEISLLLFLSFLFVLTPITYAETGRDGQLVFSTAEEALNEFKAAVKSGNRDRLTEIFGKNSRDYFFTGDPVGDSIALRELAMQFDQRAELLSVKSDNFHAEQWYLIRYGIEGWDMHIPLVNRGDGWSFATEHGTDEDIRRRRAFNEIATIDTLYALVKAQKKYQSKDRNGDGVLEYAQRFGSTPGTHDGLYWPSTDNSDLSPIDGMVVRALQDGYKRSEKGTPTYYGYVYKILTAQGGQTRGGKKSYLKDGRLVNGFAILAYPVAWQASGDFTFLIDSNAEVWQKNLGVSTESKAPKIDSMNIDRTWIRANPMLGGENSRSNWH